MSRTSRWVRLHATGNRQRYRNWLNKRARERGKTPLPDRITRRFSPLPVYRNRVNPATGRPRRDDKRLGAIQDRDLAQAKARNDRQATRARDNQQFVRAKVAERQPQFARALARAERDPRTLTAMRERQRSARAGRSR